MAILNGDIMGDKEREWTYAGGQRESVIDYATGDARTREKIRSIMVGKRVELDHYPIIVNIEGKEERRGRRKQKEKRTGEGDIGRRQGERNSRRG